MSNKKEFKSDVSRKSDKMIDIHREYLDMDTDEEDFGRQESPEVEVELPPEPEKPVFSEDEIIILIQHVKDLTIFPEFDGANWSENCDAIIREYFENPSHGVLSIFHKENKLTANLSLPSYAPQGFVYFLRSPWQIYTPENFFSTILFGSITRNVWSSILKFMENMYAPIIFHNDDYTPCIQFRYLDDLAFLKKIVIKNEVFSNLHEFLIQLTEVVYQPMGLTTLYVPKENCEAFLIPSNESFYFLLGESTETVLSETAEKKRKLIGRLENVVWSWIQQMHKAMRINTERKKIKSIHDEMNYWNAKYTNLKYLRLQVRNPEVRLIIDVLKNLHSLSAMKFQELSTSIKTRLKETSSNLMYLNIFYDFSKNLNVPENAENSVTESLLLILFIWVESPFYKITHNIEILCQTLSLLIIYQCKKYINLDIALGNNPEEGIKMLKKSILCCNIYETLYDNLMTNVVPCINPGKKWDISKGNVFDPIETFKQRCYDVIEICKASIIFRRCNKVSLIGSPRGIEYEAYWQEIENLFHKNLNEIIMIRDIIFNIRKFKWLKKIKQFRYTVQQLENMVINLINDIFKYVKNIEEGIEAIYALQKLEIRKSFRELLHNKWIQIWEIFNNEIEYCYISVINISKKKDQFIRKSDVISMLCISRYLKSQYNAMMNAFDWIGECPTKECVLERYKHVLDVIDERRKMFNTYSTYETQ